MCIRDRATTLPLEVFTQRNFVADFFRQKLNFDGKNSKIAFCATLWGTCDRYRHRQKHTDRHRAMAYTARAELAR